jgi:2-hydroxy-3-keto-5-methylthiopentenyl-1-phosphate phosphatase
MALKTFIDFDGTITTEDIGDAFFLRFGGARCTDHVREYREGRISAKECFTREAAEIRSLPLREAEAFAGSRTLTAGFVEFVGFCREHGLEFHVVSDGLDFYIQRILAANGLENISFSSNTLKLDPPTVLFPYPAEECDRCACCKRNVMLGRAGEQDIIAFIGEGYSDRCAAQYADIVFAKDELQKYCQKENISFYPYSDFHDVLSRYRQILARKRLRKRRRAELRRREAFTCEA